MIRRVPTRRRSMRLSVRVPTRVHHAASFEVGEQGDAAARPAAAQPSARIASQPSHSGPHRCRRRLKDQPSGRTEAQEKHGHGAQLAHTTAPRSAAASG